MNDIAPLNLDKAVCSLENGVIKSSGITIQQIVEGWDEFFQSYFIVINKITGEKYHGTAAHCMPYTIMWKKMKHEYTIEKLTKESYEVLYGKKEPV